MQTAQLNRKLCLKITKYPSFDLVARVAIIVSKAAIKETLIVMTAKEPEGSDPHAKQDTLKESNL